MEPRCVLRYLGASILVCFGRNAVADIGGRTIAAIPFVANAGQFDPRVAFAARTRSGMAFVTNDGKIVYGLAQPGPGSMADRSRHPLPAGRPSAVASLLTETFVGGSPRPRSGRAGTTKVGYLLGNDPAQWRRAVPTFQDVDLGEVYPGIRVRLVARAVGIEKVFAIAPGAALDAVRISVAGGGALEIESDGSLCAATASGDVAISAPVATQRDGDSTVPVAVEYRVTGRSYSFASEEYDPGRELVIDPILRSTYLGGSGDDAILAMGIAADGDVIVAGQTFSSDFPVTPGSTPKGGIFSDAFVARLSADLRTTKDAVYIGGGADDIIFALAIAANGDIVAGGYTYSGDFPKTSGGAQTTQLGAEAFVARLSPDLGTLIQATYFGGSGFDQIVGIALAANGDVVAVGQTTSHHLPQTSGGAQENPGGGPDNGSDDAFVVRLHGDLKSFVQTSYLGGAGDDEGAALAIAVNGDVIVAGQTISSNFPHVSGGAQESLGGGADAFAARLTGDLKSVIRATYLGGSDEERATSVALGANGDVVIAGYTISTDFPHTTDGVQAHRGLFNDAFVARLSGGLETVSQATYLGGQGGDEASAVAVADNGDVLVAGGAASPDFPGIAGGAQELSSGSSEAFVARLGGDLRTMVQATLLGGSGADSASAFVLDGNQDVLIAGTTGSTDLPGAARGVQPAFGGGEVDGFVARLTGDLKSAGPRSLVIPVSAPSPVEVGGR